MCNIESFGWLNRREEKKLFQMKGKMTQRETKQKKNYIKHVNGNFDVYKNITSENEDDK